jgi:hypothetical protein
LRERKRFKRFERLKRLKRFKRFNEFNWFKIALHLKIALHFNGGKC